MLEVLIAVLVFSLGMVGLAGLLIFSIQSNHVAYLRTQATFLAHNMADRMGANPVGVWNGNYGTTAAPIIFPVPATSVSCATGCTPAQLAAYDIQQWSIQLKTFLPAVTGTLGCGAAGISYLPDPTKIAKRPPYGGICQMRLTWNEAGGAGAVQQTSIDLSKQGQQQHAFQWIFQP